MAKLKISTTTCFKFIIWSIFLFNYAVREKFIPMFKDINILFFCACICIFYINNFHMRTRDFFLVCILGLQNILLNMVYDARINNVIYFNIQTILPLFLLVACSYPCDKKEAVRNTVNLYNKFMYVYFGIFLIDLVTGNALSRFLSDTLTAYGTNWLNDSFFSSRYHFFFAHPLYTCVLTMVYYLLNLMCYRQGLKTNVGYWTFHIITMVLIFSTGSKAATILFVVVFYIFNFTPKRLVLGIIAMILLYACGGMDFIIHRFLTETSFSSGRNESLLAAKEAGLLNFHFFFGLGETFDAQMLQEFGATTAGAASEYPVLVYIFRYGILFAAGMVWLLYIEPACRFLKARNYTMLICTTVLFVQLNVFNGLTALVEVEIVYVLFLILSRMLLETGSQTKDFSSTPAH